MAFGLPQKTITQLKSVFKNHPEITQVKIYGSRAKDYYRKGSDIDLAFFSESKKDLSSNLSWELDDLPSPYTFDLVNYNTLNNTPLKEEIDKYGKVFYKKNVFSPSQQKSSVKKKTSKRQSLFPNKPSVQKKQKTNNIKTLKTENLSEFQQTEIGKIPTEQQIFRKESNKVTLNNKLDISSHLKESVVNLGNVAEVSSGNSAPQNRYLFENGSYPFCRTSDVGKIHISDNFKKISDYLNDEGIKGLTLFRKNTILFPKSGVSTFLNHRVMLGIDSYVSNHLATIYANEKKILAKFLFNWLCLIDAKELTNDQTYPSLKLSEIRKIKIPCPSLLEQEKIAGILSQIRKAIETQDKLIKATKELKQSTMKQLFIYGVKGQKTKQTEIGEISDTWKVVNLKEVAMIVSGQSPKSKYYNKNGEGLPFYQGKTEFTEMYIGSPRVWTNKAIKIADKSDILMSVRAPVGPVNIAVQKSCIGRGLTAIHAEKINPLFLFYYLHSSENTIKGHGGTVFDSISREQVKSMKIPFPFLPEQEKIADILTKIDQKIQIHKKKKLRLKELFKTMLNQLMTGKIRVHKLNIPNKFMVQ